VSVEDWLGLVAAVVAAVAAAVALYFSGKTVSEAADLRRSTRSDRILDCIGDYAAVLVRAWDITHVDTKRGLILASRLRLEAAIDAVKTPHPKCRALVNAGLVNETSDPKVVLQHISDALTEASALHGTR
jgi:hypothetical protein